MKIGSMSPVPRRRTRKRPTGTHLARPRTTSTGATVPGNDGNTIVSTFRRQNKRHRPLHFSPSPKFSSRRRSRFITFPKGCYVVYISICMLRDDKRTNSEFEIRYTTIRPTLTHLTIFHSPQKNNQGNCVPVSPDFNVSFNLNSDSAGRSNPGCIRASASRSRSDKKPSHPRPCRSSPPGSYCGFTKPL